MAKKASLFSCQTTIQTQCMMCIQTKKCVSEFIYINGYMHNKAFKRPTYASPALLP
jgi:hypothetical protein